MGLILLVTQPHDTSVRLHVLLALTGSLLLVVQEVKECLNVIFNLPLSVLDGDWF